MKQDMSDSCEYAYFEMCAKRYNGAISEEEFNAWYDEHCGRCMYMSEICMKGE